ncbi:MAG: hypothetical protein ACRDR6_13415 [Pseudonocardiaceae bacterium]
MPGERDAAPALGMSSLDHRAHAVDEDAAMVATVFNDPMGNQII